MTDREPSFEDMDLSPAVRDAIAAMGFTHPTAVQTETFEPIRAGKDIVAQSKTGTGKTAAFFLPVADKIDVANKNIQLICLAPTRELAAQVGEEAARITKNLGIRITPIYGGTSFGPQIDGLKAGSHVVVGTPGRVLDHLRRRNMKLDHTRWFVLDEADEMLSMGFKDELEAILEYIPDTRQTLLFSATIPPEIRRMIDRYLTDPEEFLLSGDYLSVEQITHYYYITSHMRKPATLVKIIDFEQPDSAIIFTNTRDDASFLANFLRNSGYDSELLSGELTQAQRERAMRKIKDKNLRFLCATDVAARGIDISDLTHVINYALPQSPEMYIHRTGRTGRAGKSGTALSIVSGLDIGTLYQLTRWMKIVLEEKEIPTEAQIDAAKVQQSVDRVLKEAAAETLDPTYLELAERLLESESAKEAVALLLRNRLEAAPVVAEEAAPEPEPTEPERERESRPERKSRDRKSRERKPRERKERKRRDSTPRSSDSPRTSDADVKTIVIHVGRRAKISREEIKDFVAESGGIDRAAISDIRWRSGLAFVDVPTKDGERVRAALDGKELQGKPVKAEFARPKSSKSAEKSNAGP